MWQYYYSDTLCHANHKYIDKIKTGIGKWRYIYDYNITGKGYKRKASALKSLSKAADATFSRMISEKANSASKKIEAEKIAKEKESAYKTAYKKTQDAVKSLSLMSKNNSSFKNKQQQATRLSTKSATALSEYRKAQDEVQKYDAEILKYNKLKRDADYRSETYKAQSKQAFDDYYDKSLFGKAETSVKKGIEFVKDFADAIKTIAIGTPSIIYDLAGNIDADVEHIKNERAVKKILDKPISDISTNDLLTLVHNRDIVEDLGKKEILEMIEDQKK